MHYILAAVIALALVAAFAYTRRKYITLEGYYEIDPDFAEAASLENMSLLIQDDSGILTILEDDPVDIYFSREGNVFYSDTDSPLTNRELYISESDGVVDIFNEDNHVARFIKDNMISIQLKKNN